MFVPCEKVIKILDGLKRKECWCDLSIGDPRTKGKHSKGCIRASALYRKAQGNGWPNSREVHEVLELLRRGSCWCEVAIGNPMYKGKHTEGCKKATFEQKHLYHKGNFHPEDKDLELFEMWCSDVIKRTEITYPDYEGQPHVAKFKVPAEFREFPDETAVGYGNSPLNALVDLSACCVNKSIIFQKGTEFQEEYTYVRGEVKFVRG